MSKTKTIREWLTESLPKEYAELAIKRVEESDQERIETEQDSPSEAILGAFGWPDTEEGWLFWREVHSHLCCEDNPLPPLPTIFGPTPARGGTQDRINALRGWRIGDIALVTESEEQEHGPVTDVRNFQIWVDIHSGEDPIAFNPEELTNLSRGD